MMIRELEKMWSFRTPSTESEDFRKIEAPDLEVSDDEEINEVEDEEQEVIVKIDEEEEAAEKGQN